MRFLRIFKIVGVGICVQVSTCSQWSFKWTKIKIAWVFLLFALLLILTICQVEEWFCFMKEHTFGLIHERPRIVQVVHLSLLVISPPGSVLSSVGLLVTPCGLPRGSPGLFTLSLSSEPEGPQLQVACVKHQS